MRVQQWVLTVVLSGGLFMNTVPCTGDILEEIAAPVAGYRAARVSSYDRSGANADALSGIQPGHTAVLADIAGPGMITHIWITVNAEKYHGRKLVLRMYWDDEKEPSVLSPLNDFFCMGHGIEAPMWSIPITTTADGRARNCFFKMPFNKKARLEITNEGLEPVAAFYYYIDYRKYDKPFSDPVYFHAQYRQEYPAKAGQRYVICNARGRGHYVGTVLSIESHSEAWWGEGDDRFFVDGETTPSLHGTGAEDYLNDAWGIWKGSSPYYGCSIHEGKPYIYPSGTRYTSFRFHIADPIPFQKSLLFDIEHFGAGIVNGKVDGFVERADSYSSVAFWYQSEPHEAFEPLPPVAERLPAEAAGEKRLMGFLHHSRETQTSDSLAELRSVYAQLAADQELTAHSRRLRARMAAAEWNGGYNDRARELIATDLTPFISRPVAVELKENPEVLGPGYGPATALLQPWDDGAVDVMEKAGAKAVATNTAARKPYIYFAVPEDSPLRAKEQAVQVKVRYFSEGRPDDTFRVQYNGVTRDGSPAAYIDSPPVAKSAEDGWHVAEITLQRARFAGMQNGGADFRIASDDNGDELIASVELGGVTD